MLHALIPLTISGLVSVVILIFVSPGVAVASLGTVKCSLTINYSAEFEHAHETCWKKLTKEVQESVGNVDKYPFNATIEDYEWDDKCFDQCAYQELGMIKQDGTLPDKKETEKFFSKGQVSDKLYKVVTSAWNDCIDISAKISKAKGFDKCKTTNHHRYCFMKKRMDSLSNIEIAC